MANNELLHNLFTAFFFVFGSLLGSFSNVIILRMSSGKSVIFPPSCCPQCNHPLQAQDLLPVLSWLYLKGRCRYCQAKISWQYPVVEACISLIVGLSFYQTGLNYSFIALASTSVIWFIATIIFIRREVLAAGPYIWPALFFIIFSFPIGGCPFLNWPIRLAPIFALLIATTASFRLNYETHNSWAGLSFLFFFSLAPDYGFWPLLPLSILAVAAAVLKNQSIKIERAFAALQIIAIFANILLTSR